MFVLDSRLKVCTESNLMYRSGRVALNPSKSRGLDFRPLTPPPFYWNSVNRIELGDFGGLMLTTYPPSMNSHGDSTLGLTIKHEDSTDDPHLMSPNSSPTSIRTVGGKGKKRSQHHVGLESSPGSGEDGHEGLEDRRRPPGLKRACNECRQQKVTD